MCGVQPWQVQAADALQLAGDVVEQGGVTPAVPAADQRHCFAQ
jgi:hypothetical protein